MYCNAIMIVNAQKTNLTPAMLGERGATKLQISRISKYRPVFTNSVVTHLRQKCRYLQKIIFGRPYKYFHGYDSWIVHCEGQGGQVDIARYVTSSLLKLPPITIASPPPPSDLYTVQFRLDLELVVNNIDDWPCYHPTGVRARRIRVADPAILEHWAEALRISPAFGSLGRGLDAGQVPLSLADLMCIYERQISAGFTERLEMLLIPHLEPFNVQQFGSFARLTGASLTSLELVNDRDGSNRQLRSNIGIVNLPAIIELVRNHLPHLSQFDLTILAIA